MVRRQRQSLSFARDLRIRETRTEKLFWSHVRNRKLGGWKFRRQASIGPYIVDFLCAKAHLIIELDGDSHAFQPEYDVRRDAFIRKQGYTIIRIENHNIHESLHAILQDIMNVLGPSPVSSPFPGKERKRD